MLLGILPHNFKIGSGLFILQFDRLEAKIRKRATVPTLSPGLCSPGRISLPTVTTEHRCSAFVNN
eukprot:2374471-Rhodomonas_salina.1